MSNIKYLLPNAFTALNLLSGAVAIILLLDGGLSNFYIPAYLLAFAALCDLLDGLIAKLINATSEFGKQLDSLSDLISFGLAPSIMMYKLIAMSLFNQSFNSSVFLMDASVIQQVFLLSALAIALFSALRLARFNITISKTTDFTGLPVPASALIVVAIWITANVSTHTQLQAFLLDPYFLGGIIITLSFLMISNITMLSLKFTGLSFNRNSWRYLLILGSVIIMASMQFAGLLYVMLFYLLLSLFKNILSYFK
jgi:CDP-diacylglycerol--serine O-phosphatidyltransferase